MSSTTLRPRTSAPTRASMGIAVILVAQLMLVLDATVVNVALPHIGTDLHFDAASLSWVLNAYTLAFGGLLLLGGRLGDVLGRRRMFQIGLAVFTVASFAGGLALSPAWLVTARAAQGMGAAMAAPSVLALLTTNARNDGERNRALALFAAVSSGGASIGLLLGGVVTDLGSWRWTLFINVPIGIAAVALIGRYVGETDRRHGRFDVVGAITATLGAVALVWSLIGAPDHGWTSTRTIAGFVVGVLALALFARTETRFAHPMVQPHLVRNVRRVGALIVMATTFAGQMSVFFLVVQYDEGVLGFGPLATGFAFLPLSLGIFSASRVTPRLVARFGTAPLMAVGTLGITISYLMLSQLHAGTSYWPTVLAPMLLNGLAAGLVFMPVTSTVLSGVEPEHAGSASGLLQTTQQLGGAVGVAVIVSVYAAGAVPGQVVPGLQGAFWTAAILGTVGFSTALGLAAAGRRRAASTAVLPTAQPIEETADAA